MTACVTTRHTDRESVREQPIMARHQWMPPEEAGYTYAVEPTAVNSLLANEEESIYSHSLKFIEELNSTDIGNFAYCRRGGKNIQVAHLSAIWVKGNWAIALGQLPSLQSLN